MAKLRRRTKTEQLHDIVQDYIDAGEPWPADRRTIARWAINNKKWHRSSISMVDVCAKELAEAMRLEMRKDPQGRTVRSKLCAKISEKDEAGKLIQKTLWFDALSEKPDLIRLAVQQARTAILQDNVQLKNTVDSYNDNNPHGAFIQLSLDYENDIADMRHSTEYNAPRDTKEDGE